MTAADRTRQAAVYGGVPLLTLALVNAVQSGEVAGLGYATDGIKATFHVGDGVVGLMPTAAGLLAIPAVLLIGPLADRTKRTHVIAWLMVAWALALGLAATATAFAVLFLLRMLVGALESNGPAAISLLADYYPVEKRSRTMSRYQLGGGIGGVFGLGVGALVDLGGWRVAFWAWVPVGLLISALLVSLKEPHRGEQDVAMGHAMVDHTPTTAPKAAVIAALPEPTRHGVCDYATLDNRTLLAELWKIRSMWFALVSVTVSQLLLNATAFWSPEYFKRFHHLNNTESAGIIGLLGLGSFIGIIAGGVIADRRLARGHINSRIEMIVIGTFGATLTTGPAYVMPSLLAATPLFVIGGFFFTLPIGPIEAMLADVVPAELRGRATSIRSVVRAISAVGPAIVGGLSALVGLAPALALFTPLYAIGGLYAIKARHTYGHDLAYVLAEANRTGGDSAVEGLP